MKTHAETVSDIILGIVDATPKATGSTITEPICLEDLRSVCDVRSTARWLQIFKQLEGRTVVAVTWTEGEKPWLRTLEIQTT